MFKFSVIIAARNEPEDTLQTTVDDLSGRADVEIIIVDDASDTPIERQFSTELPFLDIVRNTQRLGYAGSRQRGCEHARGEFLVMLDAHAFFGGEFDFQRLAQCPPYAILGCETHIIRNQTDFCPGPLANNHRGARYWGWQMLPAPGLGVRARFDRPMKTAPVPYVGACGLCIRRDFFQELGGFDLSLQPFGGLEDFELCLRCWSAGGQVLLDPELCCHHYTAPQPHPDPLRCPLAPIRYPGAAQNMFRIFQKHFPESDGRELAAIVRERYPEILSEEQFDPAEFSGPRPREWHTLRSREQVYRIAIGDLYGV